MRKRWISGVVGIALMASVLTGCRSAQDEKKQAAENDVTADDVRVSGNADISANAGKAESGETEAGEVQEEWMYETNEADYDSSASMADSYADCEDLPYEAYYGEPMSGEEYGEIHENGFLSVSEQPLSTFSADVDTASYSNVRRMLLDGYELSWIPKDSVRLEEMINYFSYDYDGPKSGEPFGVNTEITRCPWNEDSYLMMVGLQTEAVDFSETPPSNLVFLIDVSGSMYSEDKLPLLQQSFAMLSSNLTSKDRVSIVTYAGEDRIVLQGAKGSDTQTIIDALERLNASGSTNGSAGIETAYELAEEYFIPGGNNRVILATDGDLNVGLTSVDELEELISGKKESGVYLSVLGFGTGNIKDNKMETLADKGNGNYAYIDSLNEARKVLVEEMGATLVTVAKDVKLQMEFNPDVVSEYRLIGYENRALANEDFTDDTKDAGEVGAGHCVTVLYEIKLTPGAASTAATVWSTLHIRYKEPQENRSTQLDYTIGTESIHRKPSENILFAGCVAQFGMLLRDSDYKGTATYMGILSCLEDLRSVQEDEYKLEFKQLVEQAMLLGSETLCY